MTPSSEVSNREEGLVSQSLPAENGVKLVELSEPISCSNYDFFYATCICVNRVYHSPFFLQIFFASILSGDPTHKDYRNIKICSKNTFLRFPQTTFHFTKEISKYTNENNQAERRV